MKIKKFQRKSYLFLKIISIMLVLMITGCSIPGNQMKSDKKSNKKENKNTENPIENETTKGYNYSNTFKLKRGDPNYEFAAIENRSFSYTHYQDFDFSAGQHVTLSTDKIDGFYPTIYFFNKAKPTDGTWMNDNSSHKIDVTIKVSGSYRCLVTISQTEGYCKNLYLNGSSVKQKFWVSFGGWYNIPYKPFRLSSQLGTTFFTCNTSSGGNTVLYVRSPANPHGIVAWNDDYKSGDAIWGYNSRCSWNDNDPNAPPVTLLVFACSPRSKAGTTDIYGYVKTDGQYNDSMRSSTYIHHPVDYYNCFAWSGGITEDPVDPSATSIYTNGTSTDVEAFDHFYGNQIWDLNKKKLVDYFRYPYAPSYVPCDIYDPEAVIDLWGVDPTIAPRQNVFHATVKGTANNQFHGFAWESKIDFYGSRYFHERRPASFTAGYGKIIRSYKLKK